MRDFKLELWHSGLFSNCTQNKSFFSFDYYIILEIAKSISPKKTVKLHVKSYTSIHKFFPKKKQYENIFESTKKSGITKTKVPPSKVYWSLISDYLFTHWHTGSSFEVAIMPTPGSNGTMPEHIGLNGAGWIRRLLLTSGFGAGPGSCSRSLVVTDVNFTDEPLKWVSFNHRRRWSRLNGGKTIDSTAESVTRIRSRTRDRTRTPRGWRPDDSGAASKGRLSSPDFVTFLCGILNNYIFFLFAPI